MLPVSERLKCVMAGNFALTTILTEQHYDAGKQVSIIEEIEKMEARLKDPLRIDNTERHKEEAARMQHELVELRQLKERMQAEIFDWKRKLEQEQQMHDANRRLLQKAISQVTAIADIVAPKRHLRPPTSDEIVARFREAVDEQEDLDIEEIERMLTEEVPIEQGGEAIEDDEYEEDDT